MSALDALFAAYARLKREYRAQRPENNPPKQSITMREDAEGVCAYVNFMGARLSTGELAVKAIGVDEDAGRTQARTLLFDKDARFVGVIDSVFLTNLRCALMAALAAERFFGEVSLDFRLGLIGTGEMNVVTAWVFHHLFGVSEFVVKGSPRNPLKNLDRFPPGTTPVRGFRGFSDCDAVISATSVPAEAEAAQFPELGGPALYIAQDGGWMLGRSFRTLPAWSDNPAQILAHGADEFPDWDANREALAEMTDLNDPAFRGANAAPAVVYLYGIALADAVVAVECPLLTESTLCRKDD